MNRERLRQELPEPVHRYFEEVARMEPPNDLMDSAMAQVESEARVSRFSLPAFFAISAAAVALVAAVLIGANLFGGGGLIGGTQTPTPIASASPTPIADSPQPWDLVALGSTVDPRESNLPAGDYYLDLPVYPGRIELTIPDGWWYYQGAPDVHAVLVNSLDSGASEGSAWGLAFAIVGSVNVDPCEASPDMDPAVAQSAADLVAAFKTWAGFSVDVENVSIGGFSGKRVVVSSKRAMGCQGFLFTTPGGYAYDSIDMSGDGTDQPQQMTFLDVNGSVLAIWTTDYAPRNDFEIHGGASPDPQAHVQDQVALHQIIDSIVITPH